MAALTQTVTTETAINWDELAQKIKDNTSGLKVGDIITEKTLDGEEMDLVVVDMVPGWARFESKDCLPVEVAYNQNNRNAGVFADSDVNEGLHQIPAHAARSQSVTTAATAAASVAATVAQTAVAQATAEVKAAKATETATE